MNSDWVELEFGDPPPPFYEALGRVAYEASKLDAATAALIAELTAARQAVTKVSALIDGENSDWLLQKLRVVVEYSGDLLTTYERERFAKLIAEAKSLIAQRNRFIHADWYYHSNIDMMHGFRNRRHKDADEFEAEVSTLAELADACRRVSTQFWEILDRAVPVGPASSK